MGDGPGLQLLKQGSKGAAVLRLQNILNASPPPGPTLGEDGIFGPVTERRLRAVQQWFGLHPDGIAGPKTFTALGVSLSSYGMLADQLEDVFRRNPAFGPQAAFYFRQESQRYERSMIPIGYAQAVIIGGIIFILFAIALLTLLETPAFKKASEPFRRRVAQELEDFRNWMAEHKPGDALKEANRRINNLVKDFQDDMADRRRRCEQEAPSRIPDCQKLYPAITTALAAINNRLRQLGDPTLWPNGSRDQVIYFLVTAIGSLIVAMMAWGECMCPILMGFF